MGRNYIISQDKRQLVKQPNTEEIMCFADMSRGCVVFKLSQKAGDPMVTLSS